MSSGNYKQELVSNTVWNAIENYSMIGIQLLCTFLLARFLTPADFGLVGMLVVFTAIAQTFVDSGFGVALIREKELLHDILDNEYYSKNLAAAIKDGTLRKDYIALYAVIPDRRPESVDFLLYRRLQDAGYEEDQLLNLFAALKREEMTPLLVYDYQWDEQGYISDVVTNRDSGHFDISGDYRQMFKISEKAPDPDSFQVLVQGRSWPLRHQDDRGCSGRRRLFLHLRFLLELYRSG